MEFSTRTIHAAQPSEPATGALVAPIFQTSTYEQQAPGVHQGFDYSRTNNPTRARLEAVLADLEGVPYAAVFASGLAAENAVLQAWLKPGEEIVIPLDVYGGTYRILTRVFQPLGCVGGDERDEEHVVTDLELVERRALGPGERVVVEQREPRAPRAPGDVRELVALLGREQQAEVAAPFRDEVDRERPALAQRLEGSRCEVEAHEHGGRVRRHAAHGGRRQPARNPFGRGGGDDGRAGIGGAGGGG